MGRTHLDRLRPGATLRALLTRSGALMAPGAFSPMAARLAEQAGFEAVYMPGGGTALDRLGVADVGLLTLDEMVGNARAIVASVEVPVIADADTGFGNALNVQRTVRDYEQAGVAALHIEDQVFPKRCGHFHGKELLPLEEAAHKIAAAVAARRDDSFMVIARCDALSVAGLGEVQRRCVAYLAAGADMLFVEASTAEQVQAVARSVPGPLVFNMAAGGNVPALDVEEVGRLGYKLMLLPNFASLAAIRAIGEVYAEMRRIGSVTTLGDRIARFSEFTALGGLEQFDRIARQFGGRRAGEPAA